MAKFASPQLKDALSEEELFERKKKDLEILKKDNTEALKPDFSRTAEEVLQDVQYKGIVARALGKEFEEREFISEKDLQQLMVLSEMNQNFRREVEIKLLPIMKHGKKWEDKESRKLRKQYVKKSQQLLDILSKFRFSGVSRSEEIFLSADTIFDKTTAYLDFASAVALVDKGPRKRKSTRASGSAYFREIYIDGVRGALFALFDGFDERGFESLPSSLAANMFREHAKNITKESEVLPALEAFARNADAAISESVKGFCGTNASFGIVLGKKLYYVNVGNNRIYGVGLDMELHRLVGEELAGFLDKDELYAELKYPYLYLGGFTQRMKGKKNFKVVHTDFHLKAPHIGIVDVSKFQSILVANSGVWKSAISMRNGKVESEESKFGELLRRARNQLSAVERMNMSVKSSMKEAGNRSMVDDIAMIYFSI